MYVATGVIPREMPGIRAIRPDPAAWSTSFPPIRMETIVGLASMARCTCVFPPRNSVVSVLWYGEVGALTSVDAAAGTATLFRMSVATAVFRRSHVVAVDPVPTRTPVRQSAIGGTQPRPASAGYAKRVPMDCERRIAYDRRCVESLMPSDCTPAARLFPIAT